MYLTEYWNDDDDDEDEIAIPSHLMEQLKGAVDVEKEQNATRLSSKKSVKSHKTSAETDGLAI